MLKNADYLPATSPDIDYDDLQTDPNELNNVYCKPGYEEITAELQQLLDNHRTTLNVTEY